MENRLGSLILCNKTKAVTPYYIEEFHLHIYTIEELCFYLCANIFVLNNSILNETLCDWIENEIDMPSLGIELRKHVKASSLTMFVLTILKTVGFCEESELDDIQHTLMSLKDRTEEEQIKKKGDNLLGRGKFELSLKEYEKIIKNESNIKLGKRFLGKVYHNVGVAYARQFMFDKSAENFLKAYTYTKNDESLKQYLISMYIKGDTEGYNKLILDNPDYKQASDKMILDYRSKERQYRFYQEQRRRDRKGIDERIEECKEEYRRSLF